MASDTERWSKLPGWAQDQYDRAVRERAHYEGRLRALETSPGDGPGDISHGNYARPWRGIPRGDTVRFRLGEVGDRMVDVLVEGGALCVRSTGGTVRIVPGGRNHFQVEVADA